MLEWFLGDVTGRFLSLSNSECAFMTCSKKKQRLLFFKLRRQWAFFPLPFPFQMEVCETHLVVGRHYAVDIPYHCSSEETDAYLRLDLYICMFDVLLPSSLEDQHSWNLCPVDVLIPITMAWQISELHTFCVRSLIWTSTWITSLFPLSFHLWRPFAYFFKHK